MVARYPHPVTQQAAPVTGLLIWLSAGNGLTFSTAWVLAVLQEIMTETGIPDGYSNEACGRFPEVNSEVSSGHILRSIWVPNSVKQVLNSVNRVLTSVKQVLNSDKPSQTAV